MFNPQIDELPFQIGTLLDPLEDEDKQDIEELCREVLMVQISEIPESDDDSLERVNLNNYHSDDFDEYLSDNMDTSLVATVEIKTSINQDPPFAPPSVMVTIKLEDVQEEGDLYDSRRVRNQNQALRLHRVAEHHQECRGDSYD